MIEKDSWIHITEAKKFESLLVSQMALLDYTKIPAASVLVPSKLCWGGGVVLSSSSTDPTGAGGVLPVPFTQRELQAVRHHVAIPLQVERAFVNSGQYSLTR